MQRFYNKPRTKARHTGRNGFLAWVLCGNPFAGAFFNDWQEARTRLRLSWMAQPQGPSVHDRSASVGADPATRPGGETERTSPEPPRRGGRD